MEKECQKNHHDFDFSGKKIEFQLRKSEKKAKQNFKIADEAMFKFRRKKRSGKKIKSKIDRQLYKLVEENLL